jgi:hypothetical protein
MGDYKYFSASLYYACAVEVVQLICSIIFTD